MAFVAVNVLAVPRHAKRSLEERFAARAGEVDGRPGFQRFELLRPADDAHGPEPEGEGEEATDRYLVMTWWDSEADFRAWLDSEEFQRGHARTGAQGPAASGAQVWTFDVVTAREPSEPSAREPGSASTDATSGGHP